MAKKPTLKVGDLVLVKGGGPVFTVSDVSLTEAGDWRYSVVGFDTKNTATIINNCHPDLFNKAPSPITLEQAQRRLGVDNAKTDPS